MASSSVFGSSPARADIHTTKRASSSSPGLPSLHQILAQNTNESNQTFNRNNAQEAVVSDASVMRKTSMYWNPTQTVTSSARHHNHDAVNHECANRSENSPSIIELDADAAPKTPPTRPSTRRPASEQSNVKLSNSVEIIKDQPRNEDGPQSPLDEVVEISHLPSEAGAQPPTVEGSEPAPPHRELLEPPSPSSRTRKGCDSNAEPLHLEQAMARKAVWTPPSVKQREGLRELRTDGEPSSSSPGDWRQAPVFKTLSETYSCREQAKSEDAQATKVTYKVVKKRKLIELVPVQPAAASPAGPAPKALPEKPATTKRKAPKKKQRTITALATAAYKTPTQPEPAPPSGSLLEHFPIDTKEVAPAAKDDPAKPKRVRKKTVKATKKKTVAPKPILLSPRAALQQVAAQDFVFGTSSQLAREQSPTFLRDLQAAMRTSNQEENTSFTTPINSDAIEPPEQRPKLWNAGARDAEGELLDLEVIDLVDNSPKLPPLIDESDPFGYHKPGGEETAGAPAMHTEAIPIKDDTFVNLSDILPSPVTKPSKSPDDESMSVSDISLDGDAQRAVTPPRLQGSVGESSMMTTMTPQLPEAPNLPPRPKYELYTDAQLSKAVTGYGFKPIKRRTAMIALLDQCWDSKVRMTHGNARMQSSVATAAAGPRATPSRVAELAQSFDSASSLRSVCVTDSEEQEPPPSAQPQPPSPKPKARGRPRKDPSTPTKKRASKAPSKKVAASKTSPSASKKPAPTKRATQTKRKKSPAKAVIEIPDSASDDMSDDSTSRRSSPEPTFSSPLPLDLSVSVGEDTELTVGTASPGDQEALFGHVTKAITTAPRTTDPAMPSWHEKILMYDPIVLEDLTTWLNSGQLTRVGFDGEVSPGEVKQWCEAKSICCLWKVNLRGKERKRL